jgi:hypothetical protein
MQDQERVEWLIACDSIPEGVSAFQDQNWTEAREKSDTLSRFVEWRKYGIPDRNVTWKDLDEYVWHHVKERRATDASYGTISEENVAHLTEAEEELASWAIQHFDFTCNWLEQPIVNHIELNEVSERLGVTFDDLVDKNILATFETDRSILFRSGQGYVLVGKFATFMMMQPFRFAESDSSRNK